MAIYNTPGVFVEEIPTLAPSIVAVSTAIPAFIGFTELAGSKDPDDRPQANKAVRITSLRDYEDNFGGAFPQPFGPLEVNSLPNDPGQPSFYLYYQLQMFYANGGGPCYIVSVGSYTSPGAEDEPSIHTRLLAGINALERVDEPTLILIPDALRVAGDEDGVVEYYGLYQQALLQCSKLKNRFTIIDLHQGNSEPNPTTGPVSTFRDNIGTNHLNYGAAYYPWLETTLGYYYKEDEIAITGVTTTNTRLKFDTSDLSLLPEPVPPIPPAEPDRDKAKREYYENRSLYHTNTSAYYAIVKRIKSFRLKLPPGPALAGIYAWVDDQLGVHKAPANVSINNVIRPLVEIDDQEQDDLNNPSGGKAINAIRFFQGRGKLVWGARTLDALSNEWRYIPVRRFFLFAEESIKRALHPFVFESNDSGTWVTVKSMINSFLVQQWRQGVLAGAKEEQAFYVSVGLGETMSSQDVLEGRLIVEVGMAVVRPAEFIILRFTHKLQEA